MKSVRKVVKDNLGFLANNNNDDDGVLTLGAVELVEAARERIFALQDEEKRWKKREQELLKQLEKAKNFGKTQSRIADDNYASLLRAKERIVKLEKAVDTEGIIRLQSQAINLGCEISQPFTVDELLTFSSEDKDELKDFLANLIRRLQAINEGFVDDDDSPIFYKGISFGLPSITKEEDEDLER